MYLVAFLAGQDAGYATPHATFLGYATSLVALFGFNVYQHTIARNGENLSTALDSCSFQYRFLQIAGYVLWAVLIFGLMLGRHLPVGLLAILAGLGLAQSEVTFSMATARGKVWRSLLYYGSQSVFFACYLLLIWQKMPVASTVLISAIPLLWINHWAHQYLRSPEPMLVCTTRVMRIEEYRERGVALLANAPVAATVPVMIYLMGNYTGQSGQIPNLLLYISFAGAVVFIMGNTYQFYGHDMICKLVSCLNCGQWRTLLLMTIGVISICLFLTVPVGALLGLMKSGKIEYWTLDWYFCVGAFASGVALNQWYSAMFVSIKRPLRITIPNSIYFFMVIFFTVFDFFNFTYAITISIIIRLFIHGVFVAVSMK